MNGLIDPTAETCGTVGGTACSMMCLMEAGDYWQRTSRELAETVVEALQRMPTIQP